MASVHNTLGVGGVDPVNNIILYIIILYIIYTYTAYGFPIRAASSRSASASAKILAKKLGKIIIRGGEPLSSNPVL